MACLAETGEKQAAPGNEPAFGCSTGLSQEALGQSMALGNSRQPPTFPVATRDRARCCLVLRYALKRLPSSALGNCHADISRQPNRGRGRRRGRLRFAQAKPLSLLQRSLTRSLFFARYDRPEKRVNTTATESTPVPTPEAIFSAVGER